MNKPQKQIEKLNITVALRTLKRALLNGDWQNAIRIRRMIMAGTSLIR